MAQQLSSNTFTVAQWVVSADATQGTHTTIAGAIASASSGDSIFIRSGTYTENLTLKAGVNLTAIAGSERVPTVTIIGNATFTAAGTVAISDIRLQTNASFCVSVTGIAASILKLNNCFINATNNTAISFTSSSASAAIMAIRCNIDVAAAGIAMYSMTSAGTLELRYCNTTNSGGTSTASASSSGRVNCLYTNILSPISTSGTAVFNNQYSSIDTSAQNATCLSSTGNGTSTSSFSSYFSGTASCISVGGTATQDISVADLTSSNVNAITGAGSGALRYAFLHFSGTSAGINTPNIQAETAVNIIGTTINISAGAIATTLNFGSGAAAKLITIGSTNGASSLTQRVGSGNYSLDGVAASTYNIGASTTTGTVTIGGTAQTGTMTLGSSSGTNIVNVGTGAGATTVNIATGATNAKAVNIATGAVANVVTIGTTTGAASMALKYGTADFTLASATGTVMSALDTGEITMPLQPAFLAYLPSIDSNVTGNSAVYTMGSVTALTEVFDQNNDFNTNGTFTAPVTGKYQINSGSLVIGCTIASGYNQNFVTSNRSYLFQIQRAAGSQNFGLSGGALVDMDAGDTMTVTINVTGEAANTADIYGDTFPVTFISGSLIC